ncbi:hypothetical protein JRQ81_006514 [Phrynocephalus forsythii]|uniref:Centrosomal protein of 162 kDa n=1 Tax=Phrynocephalus forsythii TaxID=171643 RepID=A0A9Q0Y5P3_9SAUR|nr:hypothetical protein JRQ81_006514 [Phrynocephalus forsythii]
MAHRFLEEDLDEQFEQFLKESLSDDSFGNEPQKKSSAPETVGPNRNKEQSLPWWISEKDLGDGTHGTNDNFLKSQRLSRCVMEVDGDQAEEIQIQQPNGVSVSLSRDSLETNDSVVASGPNDNLPGPGLDTLEEQEEKERFFADLEKGASSTIDYSRLNKELDSNDSDMLQVFLRNHSAVKQVEEGNEDEPENHEKSGDYAEDFEEDSKSNEGSNIEPAVISEAKQYPLTSICILVVLDSQDSTLEAQKSSDQLNAAVTEHHLVQEIITDERNRTGISGGQTNSDIEALHQAYYHIEQSLGDTDEQKINADKIGNVENLVKDVSQDKEDGTKNTSATDSDLPTIEELMKPIRVDSSFARNYHQESESCLKDTHNTDELLSHFQVKEPQNGTYAERKSIGNLIGQHSKQENVSIQPVVKEKDEKSHQEKTDKDRMADKIKNDIWRLNTLSNSSTLHQDYRANQIHQTRTWKKECLDSVMNKQIMYKNTKSTAGGHRKKSLSSVRSSGYGKSSASLKHLPAANEKSLKEGLKKPGLKSKYPSRQKELSGTQITQATNNPDFTKKNYGAVLNRSTTSNLPEAAQESDSCLHIHNSSDKELYLLTRVHEAEEKLAAAHDLIQHQKATCLQKEKEIETKIMEMKMQQDKTLFQLNQEKYVLRAQLNQREGLNKETKWSHICEGIPENGEVLKEIKKELQNQERLLQGYQQENERLYNQVKALQLNNKKNEENMFRENQHLMAELASLREQMDKNNILSHGGLNTEPMGNQRVTDLISELKAAKVIEANLLDERKNLKQEKQVLEVDLVQMKKERDLARAQIASTSAEKSYELRVMEESYKEEISRLHKRLQWYAENQELLDKDAAHLREAKEEIKKLRLEIDKLRSEAGSQTLQQKKRLKDRTADAKRIQDLERQVKEMEGILKRRHPNSLPALIYAAAAAASSEGSGDSSAKTNTADFLEKRVKKLEAELEGKDDEAKKSLRTMEQQFQKLKLQYEKRIGELEQLLTYKLLNEPKKTEDDPATLMALENELCSVKEAHQITVRNLQAEIDSLKNQKAQLELQKNTTDKADLQSLEYQVEQAHSKAQLVRLNQEVIAKNREIQDLTKTVERLQKERMIMLSDKHPSGKTERKEKATGILKKNAVSSAQRNPMKEEFFPAILDDKIYHPDAFADSSISELLQENAQLKKELEKLTLEFSQQRVKSQAVVANSENLVRRVKEDAEEYIASLKASHQKEVETILCQYATEYSTSKVAELNSKISTQEILIKHLQQQVRELQRDQEALAVSQKREEILQKEMAKLLEELREARENQSPEMRHFVCLERKIKHLETRYEQREQELQQVIQETRYMAEVEQIQEIEKWRKLALLKNQDLEKFRIQLDSMLDVLRQLQKQGVVIPVGGSNVSESYWKI